MKWRLVLLGVILVVGCGKSEKTLDRRGRATACHVHNVALKEETREAKPRFTVSWEPEFEKAMRSEFPYLGHAFGIRDQSVTRVIVRYCPKCREARDKWRRDDSAQGENEPNQALQETSDSAPSAESGAPEG